MKHSVSSAASTAIGRRKHRYHFNLSDGDMLLPDPKGIDLPDNKAALRHAQLLARSFKWIRWSICVSDEEGNTIAKIRGPTVSHGMPGSE
jgi:hypothetical protein